MNLLLEAFSNSIAPAQAAAIAGNSDGHFGRTTERADVPSPDRGHIDGELAVLLDLERGGAGLTFPRPWDSCMTADDRSSSEPLPYWPACSRRLRWASKTLPGEGFT